MIGSSNLFEEFFQTGSRGRAREPVRRTGSAELDLVGFSRGAGSGELPKISRRLHAKP